MKRLMATLLCVVSALTLCGCTKTETEIPELLTPVGAQTDTCVAVIGDMEQVEIYEAAIGPRCSEMCFTHDARIGSVNFKLGDAVNEGDVIIEMDVSSVKAQIAALEEERDGINDEAAYQKSLWTIDMEIYALEIKKCTQPDETYEIETEMALYDLEYKNEEARLNERLTAIDGEIASLNSQLTDTALISPYAGRVTYLGCARGQNVGAYDTVCVVTNDSDAVLQSGFISSATLSGAVEIYALIGGKTLEVTPEPIDEEEYARAVLRGGEYLSTFTIADISDLKLGDAGILCVVTARLNGVLKVPVNAVFEADGEYYVYVMDGESRVNRPVSVGFTTDTEAEITFGLEEGESVYVGD